MPKFYLGVVMYLRASVSTLRFTIENPSLYVTVLVTILTWAKPCIEHTYCLYQSMYFETDERLIDSARKYISIQSLYSVFIAVKWLGGFTSTGIEV